MMIKIKNWKLFLLSLVLVGLLTSLGFWQLSRAKQKTTMLNEFQHRTQLGPFTAKDLSTPQDWRYYQLKLTGKFDDAHTILLDNKTFNGKVGYEVYTPFTAKGLDTVMLVDRGFIPLGVSRDSLPAIPNTAKGSITIQGMLNVPPTYVSFGEMRENGKTQWPLRVEYINLPEISKLLKANFYPYILNINPESPSALQVKWQILTVDPNKHMGYAVQWFALALTLLIISLVLNRAPKKSSSKPKKAATKT
jgi:surfeit locus 1 family protein